MKDSKLKMMVTEACTLDREIAGMTEKLKGLKSELVNEAQSREEDQVKTDGGGWSVTFEGTDGNVCRVTTPGDALKPSIDGEGKAIEKIREVCGVHFCGLFLQAPKWKLAPNFREEAQRLFGKSAGKLIKLVSKATSPSVSFETKDIAKLILICLLPFLGGCYTPSEEEKAAFWLKQIAVEEKQQTAYLQQIAADLENQPAQLKRISDDVRRSMLKAYPLTTQETTDMADRAIKSMKEKR
jgi:hypothetical protein